MDKQPEIPARVSRVDRTPLAAYFSMEIALESLIPTYAGALACWRGTTIRSATDPDVPMVAATLSHRHGY